jgi:cytochrome c5
MKTPAFTALFCTALLLTSATARTADEVSSLKEAPGRETTATRCALCHSLDYVEMNAAVLDRSGWQKTVRKMIDRFGAPVTDDEAREIVDYLATHYSNTP